MSIRSTLRSIYDSFVGESHNYKIVEGDDGVRRHHDPHWYLEETDDSDYSKFIDGAVPERNGRLLNNSDYPLPQSWGKMSVEERNRWFTRYRIWRQINRQHDAGMWDQWDMDRLQNSLMAREVAKKYNDDDYEVGGDVE